MASWGFQRPGIAAKAREDEVSDADGEGRGNKRGRSSSREDFACATGYGSAGRGNNGCLDRVEHAVGLLLKPEASNTLQMKRFRAILMRTWMINIDS